MAVDIFFSYSHNDKALASQIKDEFQTYGFDVFLAHEDIEPSKQWQGVILEQLAGCEVFVALLTQAFYKSKWTQQETGIAFARSPIRPVMVPINAGRGPGGFLAVFQDIKLDLARLDEATRPSWGARSFKLSYLARQTLRIVRSVADENERIAAEVRNFLIDQVEDVGSFDDAGVLTWKLATINGLTPAEINRFLEAATKNDQVYGAGSASSHIRALIDKNKKNIKRRVLTKFYEVWVAAPGKG